MPASLRRLNHAVRAGRPRLRPDRSWWLIALVVVLVGALTWVVLGTSVLGVRTVTVTGSTLVAGEEVRALAGVVIGTPLARVDTAAVEARVRTLPSVAAVDVSRSWPSTLVIEITERVGVAVVHGTDGYLVLDPTGVAFTTTAAAPKGLVQLRVTTAGAIGPDDPATVAAVRVAMSLTGPLRSRVRELVAESATNIRLELRGGLTVFWGDAENSDVKAQVATALLGKASNRIDVSSPDVAAVS